MQNINIHQGMDKKEIRDFLAKELQKGFAEAPIEFLENEIKRLQECLERSKKYEACMTLIRQNGWEIFDISDDIADYHKETYFPFVGTEEEKNLLKSKEK